MVDESLPPAAETPEWRNVCCQEQGEPSKGAERGNVGRRGRAASVQEEVPYENGARTERVPIVFETKSVGGARKDGQDNKER